MRWIAWPSSRKSSSVPLIVVLVEIALSVATMEGLALGSGLRVEVTSDQRVSLSGRSTSRKSVIEDVCYRAGVDLIFYDADDRTYGGTYVDLPLRTLLERLLADESFIVEMRSLPGSSGERITSLRVLGNPAVAAARRARSVARKSAFRVPPELVRAAFEAQPPAKAALTNLSPDLPTSATPPQTTEAGRNEALAALASRIAGDPQQLQGFLTTDSKLIAQALVRYGNVGAALNELKGRFPDSRIAAKIDEIVAALATAKPANFVP